MPKLTIDGVEIEVAPGTSVLQAAEAIGAEIPRFCFHDRLSVAGNCRMCLVEVSPGPPKPAASCCLPAADGMVVKTDSPMVRDARAGVMEFLLMNHPLDCPICDQGGECDLQDQAVGYGRATSRLREDKRAVEDKNLGPLIKTVMTRCINCTRCMRFVEEVAGAPVLGQFHRGEEAEVGTFVRAAVATEMSGNLVDICPVGALTSKPYAFRARPWELTKTPSIDVHDALGANIRVDSRGREVVRILPRLHEGINEEWIDDRTRFACDGLAERRLDRPWVRDGRGVLREASWAQALAAAAQGLAGRETAALAGDLADVESIVALADLMDALGSPHRDCRVDGAVFDVARRCGWLMNAGIAGVDEADALLLVATDPQREATVLSSRIFRAWRERALPIALIGPAIAAPYAYEHLGEGPDALEKCLRDRTGFAKTVKAAANPLILAGMAAFRRSDGLAVHHALYEAAERFGARFGVLHRAASRVGALEVGFTPCAGGLDFAGIVRPGSVKALISLGTEVDVPVGCFTVYIGHHGDAGAARADVILPGCAYTEKDATYVNTEGRPQRALRAIAPPGLAREDWRIVADLAAALGRPLPYADIAVRIAQGWPHLARWDVIEPAPWAPFGTAGPTDRAAFALDGAGYYRADVICRASPTMAQCAQVFAA